MTMVLQFASRHCTLREILDQVTFAAGVMVFLALISAAGYVTNICNVRKDLFPLSVYLLVVNVVLRSE